jgi:hypothetical protein
MHIADCKDLRARVELDDSRILNPITVGDGGCESAEGAAEEARELNQMEWRLHADAYSS